MTTINARHQTTEKKYYGKLAGEKYKKLIKDCFATLNEQLSVLPNSILFL
jgi:hypothetical protein